MSLMKDSLFSLSLTAIGNTMTDCNAYISYVGFGIYMA